jgi:hypothetical protein
MPCVFEAVLVAPVVFVETKPAQCVFYSWRIRATFVIKTPQRLNGEGETPVRMEIDVVDQGILCSSP